MQPVFVLLGPPGAGKGTQGARIAARYQIPKISTGEIFRDLAAAGTELGTLAKSYWSNGKLVPDEIVVGLVKERTHAGDCSSGFLLDGFPRTVAQAQILDCLLEQMGRQLTGVLYFSVGAEALIQRLSGRRNCAHCGATYHVTALPPLKDNICDWCGGNLQCRDDDSPDSIRVRLGEYDAKTAPLLAYYEGAGKLCQINAAGEPDEVCGCVERVLAGFEGVPGALSVTVRRPDLLMQH